MFFDLSACCRGTQRTNGSPLARGRRSLLLENLVLRQQLSPSLKLGNRGPRPKPARQLFWGVAVPRPNSGPDGNIPLIAFTPETVVAFGPGGGFPFLYWKLILQGQKARGETNRTPPKEVQELISEWSLRTPRWGAPTQSMATSHASVF